MTRKIDKEKYERILKRLAKGETQKSIVIAEKCSYGTISAAKQWDKMGRLTTITTTSNSSTNRTKIVISLPNFWLERLNEDIVTGIWTDYSDAVVDIIRNYYRTRMEESQGKSYLSELSKRKKVIRELKEFFEVREHPQKPDDSVSKEREKYQESRNSELKKEIELIRSSFNKQDSENYTFFNYHGHPLIKEEYEVLVELEKQVGIIPKWDYIFGEPYKINEKPYTFFYSILGNHIVALIIMNKGLTTLPKSIKQLKYLHTLDLRLNKLTDLPESIGQFEYLEELILHDNSLRSIPESIGNLKNLGILQLDNNELTSLPDTICNLKTRAPIGLTNNKISSLSEKILKYYKANTLELDLVGNPILDTLEIKSNLYETKLWRIRMRELNREKLNK